MDGSISNVTIVKHLGAGCAQEAARVVAAMPKWIPGMVDGKPVRVRYILPVRFRLEYSAKWGKPKKKKWWQRDSLFGN